MKPTWLSLLAFLPSLVASSVMFILAERPWFRWLMLVWLILSAVVFAVAMTRLAMWMCPECWNIPKGQG